MSCVISCGKKNPPSVLQQDIYIWQRVWTPALLESLQTITSSVQHLHVLAAEFDVDEKAVSIRVDFSALQNSTLPIYAVVRIDGRSNEILNAHTHANISALAEIWQKKLPALAGIEIDYDCPTAQLPHYVQFLKQLRAAIPSPLKLVNTALPTWIESPVLSELLMQTDSSILQVHAVLNPQQGLFDEVQALAWVKSYKKIATKSFQVALPAYGSKVVFSADGKIISIQSEQLTMTNSNHALELNADPNTIAKFIQSLSANQITNIIWFRLPTSEDQRAWSITTLLAVMNQQPLFSKLELKFVPESNSENDKYHKDEKSSGLINIEVVNQGNIAADSPLKVTLKPANFCSAADGINGYQLELEQGTWTFKREQYVTLLPQQNRTIGWLRCSSLLQSSFSQLSLSKPAFSQLIMDKLDVTFE